MSCLMRPGSRAMLPDQLLLGLSHPGFLHHIGLGDIGKGADWPWRKSIPIATCTSSLMDSQQARNDTTVCRLPSVYTCYTFMLKRGRSAHVVPRSTLL